MKPARTEPFAASLAADDRVALAVTGNAWEIARIVEPHVGRVIVVSPSDTGSVRRARRPTGLMRGCWPRGRWARSGCPTGASG